jgi:hypothetical protein
MLAKRARFLTRRHFHGPHPLYVVWIGADDLPLVSTSVDAGASWSRPIRFAAPDVKHSELASIAVGEKGRVAVSYIGTDADLGERGYFGEPSPEENRDSSGSHG